MLSIKRVLHLPSNIRYYNLEWGGQHRKRILLFRCHFLAQILIRPFHQQ